MKMQEGLTNKNEMRKEIVDFVATLPGREYQRAVIGKIGRDYVHFLSLHEGSKPQKIRIEYFYETKNLYDLCEGSYAVENGYAEDELNRVREIKGRNK